MNPSIIEQNKDLNDKQKTTINILFDTIEKYEPVDSFTIEKTKIEIMCEKNDFVFNVNKDGSLCARY